MMAAVALLKCIYTGELHLTSADTRLISTSSQPHTPSCGCINSTGDGLPDQQCWQELCVRVIKLADKYAVQGVMDVAVAKLKGLFSRQVSQVLSS